MADKKTVTVKLVRSVIGTKHEHRATVRGLGLRRLNSVSTLEDTPAVRGMINKVDYLVQRRSHAVGPASPGDRRDRPAGAQASRPGRRADPSRQGHQVGRTEPQGHAEGRGGDGRCQGGDRSRRRLAGSLNAQPLQRFHTWQPPRINSPSRANSVICIAE
jgi:large subunit ribosomal protein L30